jgi:hypothetical protein
MDDVSVPSYYIAGREIPIETLLQLLDITPPYCSIVVDLKDIDFGRQINQEVLTASSMSEACMVAKKINQETNRCPVIVGDGKRLTAHYAKEEESEQMEEVWNSPTC